MGRMSERPWKDRIDLLKCSRTEVTGADLKHSSQNYGINEELIAHIEVK